MVVWGCRLEETKNLSLEEKAPLGLEEKKHLSQMGGTSTHDESDTASVIENPAVTDVDSVEHPEDSVPRFVAIC